MGASGGLRGFWVQGEGTGLPFVESVTLDLNTWLQLRDKQDLL